MKLKIVLDPWQKKFIETKGDKILCCGRQVGKSVICGIDAGEYAIEYVIQDGWTDVFHHWEFSGAVHVVDPYSQATLIQLSGENALAELKAIYDIPSPILWISNDWFSFTPEGSSASFNIKNSGENTLNWNITSDESWLSVNPSYGSTTTEIDSVTITVDRSGLSEGKYYGTLNISSNGGSKSISISVPKYTGSKPYIGSISLRS